MPSIPGAFGPTGWPLILALNQREDVRLTKLAAQLPGTALQRSKIKQLHRFFKNIRLSEDVLARFVLSFANPRERLWLVIDRINWRLGKTEINILLVAVILNGQALALMWTLLPHGGSSNAAIRNALMGRVLHVLPAKRIAGLLGDREFIGKKWLKFLNKSQVAPCIRLKANTKVGGMPVWALFKGIPVDEVRWWYRPLMVYGVSLRVCAVRDTHSHLLYIATLERGQHALEAYSRRWSVECLFKHWKRSEFDLEATHLTHPERLSTLLALITLTSVWAWRIGDAEQKRAPIPVLAHGRLALSVVRYGLNTLKSALVNVLWRESLPDTLHPRLPRLRRQTVPYLVNEHQDERSQHHETARIERKCSFKSGMQGILRESAPSVLHRRKQCTGADFCCSLPTFDP